MCPSGSYEIGNVIPISVKTRGDLNFFQRRLSNFQGKKHGWDWPYFEFYLASFQNALANLDPKPDAVVVHNDWVSPRYLQAVLPDARVFVYLHNEQKTNQSDADFARSLAAVHKVVAVSDCTRGWTERHFPALAPDKLVTVLNGADLEEYQPAQNWLDDSDTLRVLFLGRIDPNKGPDLVADAVLTLQSEGRSVTLTVVGARWWYAAGKDEDDPYFRSLKEKMAAAHADYRGHVTRPDVPALVQNHDVVCLPARSSDPCPLVAFEALASGCALVVSNRGGLPEIVGDAAPLINPDVPGALTSELRKLASDPALLRAQKQKARARAACVSWDVNVDKWEAILSA